ncbi:MAG: Ig-like domain-containing protein, partial [Planctomycetota bacterium]
TVTPSDDPPTAVNDSFTVTEDAAQTAYDVLANDTTDADSQAFVINTVGTPSQGGSVSINTDGTQFFYTPAADFAGTETVTYQIRDTGGGLDEGTVTFTVTNVNDPPPTLDVKTVVIRSEGATVVIAISDLPTNVDSGETLTFTAVSTTAQGGVVAIGTNDDEITYTPPSGDFTGEDTFTYTVSDGNGLTETGTITVTVADFERRSLVVQPTSSSNTEGFSYHIRLTGTDVLGQSVDRLVERDADGVLMFDELAPGSYQIEVPAIPFLQNAEQPQQISFESALEDGDAAVSVNVGRLRPEFVSIRDWLGSTRQKAVLAAIEPGEEAVFSRPTESATDVQSPVVSLNDAGTIVTISGTNGSDAAVEATMSVENNRFVEPRGQVGDLRLFRISLENGEATFTETSPSATTQAEGELASQDGATSLLLGDTQPEGEAAAALSVQNVLPPSSPSVASETDETILADDGPGIDSQSASTPLVTAEATDSVMPTVSSRLRRIASADDDVASSDESTGLEADAVDQALRSRF